MTNLEKYNEVFKTCLGVKEEALAALEYQSIPEWDSVGHMDLISELEEAFDIMLETDDIVDFSSYEIGMNLLKKYNIDFD